MGNIWEVLLQTLTVSLTAGLLLLLKKIFEDKLPPRWQYTVWFLLGLRILLPAATLNRYVILPLPVWIETLKASAERHLTSVFSAPFEPVNLVSGLPMPSAASASDTGLLDMSAWSITDWSITDWSITDWLFAAYVGGVIVCLLRYIISYVQLRRLLRRGRPAPAAVLEQVRSLQNAYGLKNCRLNRVVLVDGLPSAFVCGVWKPVLALPSEAENDSLDDKILLHELLHLQYRDALQSIFWSLLRAVHWYNPFMQYVFNRIAGDMEALCDQRVLERLEGEERRDYGRILLSMTNEKYPHAFGTTSLSNGAANIARRIGCIARFKRYPQGMALVSVCIALMLLGPLFVGTATYTLSEDDYREPAEPHTFKQHAALAETRLTRCTTLAGAVDTYAKGLILQNPYYLAAASPASAQAQIEEYLRQNPYTGSWQYNLDNQFTGGSQAAGHTGYLLFNLRQTEDTSCYYTELLIPLAEVRRPESELSPGEYKQYMDEEMDLPQPGYAYFPVKIYIENSRWVVEQTGERRIALLDREYYDQYFLEYDYAESIAREFPNSYGIYHGQGEKSEVTVINFTHHTVNNYSDIQRSSWLWRDSAGFSTDAHLDASFYENYDSSWEVYTFTGSEEERAAVTEVQFVYKPVYDLTGATSVSQLNAKPDGGSESCEAGEWDGVITGGSGGGGTYIEGDLSSLQRSLGLVQTGVVIENYLPPAYSARIQLNGETVDEFLLLPSDS